MFKQIFLKFRTFILPIRMYVKIIETSKENVIVVESNTKKPKCNETLLATVTKRWCSKVIKFNDIIIDRGTINDTKR
jgi:hypothetical protein